MKFYELCNYTILNEMAARRKEDILRNTIIDKKKLSPEDIEQFKKYGTKNGDLYLLNRLDPDGRSTVVNAIIDSLQDSYSEKQELDFDLVKGLVKEFQEKEMSVPKAQLGYTLRILTRLLLTTEILKIDDSKTNTSDSTEQDQSESQRDLNFNIDFNALDDQGIPAVDEAFVNVITTAVRNTFSQYQEKNTSKVSETKLQRDLTVSLDTAMQESDVEFREQTRARIKQAAAGPSGRPMSAVIKVLTDSGAIIDQAKSSKSKEYDEDGITPLLDLDQDDDFSITPDFVRQQTGYEPDMDFDSERDYGIQFQ